MKEPDYERIFSTENPPLKRLELWCDYIRSVQKQRHKKYEQVCGCPYTSVGGELATQDKKIRLKTRDLIDRHVKYLTGTIADAMKAGVTEAGDPETKSKLVHAFVVGLLLRWGQRLENFGLSRWCAGDLAQGSRKVKPNKAICGLFF